MADNRAIHEWSNIMWTINQIRITLNSHIGCKSGITVKEFNNTENECKEKWNYPGLLRRGGPEDVIN